MGKLDKYIQGSDRDLQTQQDFFIKKVSGLLLFREIYLHILFDSLLYRISNHSTHLVSTLF